MSSQISLVANNGYHGLYDLVSNSHFAANMYNANMEVNIA